MFHASGTTGLSKTVCYLVSKYWPYLIILCLVSELVSVITFYERSKISSLITDHLLLRRLFPF